MTESEIKGLMNEATNPGMQAMAPTAKLPSRR